MWGAMDEEVKKTYGKEYFDQKVCSRHSVGLFQEKPAAYTKFTLPCPGDHHEVVHERRHHRHLPRH